MDINGRYTQRDVQAAWVAWSKAAHAATPDYPVINALWQAFCRIDDAANGKPARVARIGDRL